MVKEGGPNPKEMGLTPEEMGLTPIEIKKSPETKLLYKGIWAENLKNNQELPLGGGRGPKQELTTKLKLDFDQFASQVENFTEKSIRASYEQEKQPLANWLNKKVSDTDLYLIYVANIVLQKMQELLEVKPEQADKESERLFKYADEGTPSLSGLKGKTMCAERAAMGQFLLQRAGLESAYVSGVSIENAKDEDKWSEEHSYLVVKNPNNEENYIFDIARPHQQTNLARVLKPSVPFNYELLKGKKDLLVQARDVLQGGGELWFGVGEQACGKQNFIENKLTNEQK